MTNDEAIYQSYHGMVSEISNGLERVGEVCAELNMQETRTALVRSGERMKKHTFSIGILGEFKRGKSTVINALLGREIMPADILPTSATMNRVTYGMEPKAQIYMRDGSRETIAVDSLVDYVTKLDEQKAAMAEQVEEAIVYYPCRFCRNGVDIIDTPGLNDEGRMDRIVEEVIPRLDAVIMVITPDSPFSMSESEFVRSKLMTSDIGRLIFLINKFDLVRKRDQERVLQEIRRRIQTSVMEKMREIHGSDSPVYREMESKLASIRIFPVSALDALEGRLEGDEAQLEGSGMLAFEEALGKMLTEERGALELGVPLTQILHSCERILLVIDQCRTALDCSEEEFKEAQRKMLAESHALCESQTAKREELNRKAARVKSELSARAEECYSAIEDKARQIIGEISLENPRQALTDEIRSAMIDQAAQRISDMSKKEMNVLAERIIHELNQIVGQESLQTAQMITQYEMKLDDACRVRKNGVQNTLGAIALDTVTTLFVSGCPGLGGAVSGYQAAGVKGALVGGGLACASGLTLLLTLAPIGIVGLPLVAIASVSGTLLGKTVCDAVFKASRNQKALEELKAALTRSFDESSRRMRRERELEKWIEGTVEGQFSLLVSAMNEECQRVIGQANETIDNIRMALVRSATEKKNRMEDYDRLQASIVEIRDRLMPLKEQLASCIHD